MTLPLIKLKKTGALMEKKKKKGYQVYFNPIFAMSLKQKPAIYSFWWLDHTSIETLCKELHLLTRGKEVFIIEKHLCLCLTVGSVWSQLVVCHLCPCGCSLQLPLGLAAT